MLGWGAGVFRFRGKCNGVVGAVLVSRMVVCGFSIERGDVGFSDSSPRLGMVGGVDGE